MTETETKERGAQRLRLGERALNIAGDVAGGDRVNQEHLEEAIRRLQDRPQVEKPTELQDLARELQDRFDAIEDMIDDFEDRQKAPLASIHKGIITLCHVIKASAAKRSDEIEASLDELRDLIVQHQIIDAKSAGIDTKEIEDLHQKLEVQHRIHMEAGQSKEPTENAIER
ncbi:MAG: hypothetical protein P8L32_00455 [Paracoccaceae bacterium]|nr:hypothetical protein [Paracoccaceae bacterium]